MSKAKHVISHGWEGQGYRARCECGWKGTLRWRGESDQGPHAARLDGHQHAIEVVMAMPMLPDEYRSRFEDME